MQITETQAIDKRSRVVRGRFDCGWVTLIDGEGKLVLDWTAEPPTQLLRDKDLQVPPPASAPLSVIRYQLSHSAHLE